MGTTLDFTEADLLESHAYAAPLIVGGVRCHGGFDETGTYVSPRTRTRVPAIEAWQEQHCRQFGTDLMAMPLDAWPAHFPNVAQAKYLISNGVPEPVMATLTRIGTVEGYGGYIRLNPIPTLARCFEEDIAGTTTAHLGRGLYEAHARDEAGHDDEGGHNTMWFAARDIAFEHRLTEEDIAAMLKRMGIGTPSGAPFASPRILPDDLDPNLEPMIEFMVRLLLIEISAFHAFAWAEAVLSDTDLVAGDGEAARVVSYIRSDETPHVEYLRTTLTEMRDRTFVGSGPKRYPGSDLIGRLWDRAVAQSLGERQAATRQMVQAEIDWSINARPNRDDLRDGFEALA